MKKIILILSIPLLALVGLVGYRQYQRIQFSKVKVSRGKIRVAVAAPGRIVAEKQANLSFKATGRIAYLPVKENDSVQKGQVVAGLDTSDLKANLAKELKDYLSARWDWEQQRDDYAIEGDYQQTPDLSDTEKRLYEKKQFSLDQAVIEVETADRAVKNAFLYAPFTGVVTRVNGEVNEWVSVFSSQPLVQLVDFSTLYFEAEVDQEDSDQIKVGQQAIIELDAKPGQSFTGKVADVSRVTRTTSEGDTVVPVKIKLDHWETNLKLGWEGDVQIILEEKTNAVLLPKKAVQKEGGEAFVYLWQDRKLKKRKVNLGVFDGTNWEVLDGLTASEEVAVKR